MCSQFKKKSSISQVLGFFLQVCWRKASGALWLNVRIGKHEHVNLEIGNAATWLYTVRTALWAESGHIKQLVTGLYMKNGFGLQSTTTSHELQSKLQLMFVFCLVGGSFFDVSWVNLCTSLFPVFLPSCICGAAISLQSYCWLSCCPTCCSAP